MNATGKHGGRPFAARVLARNAVWLMGGDLIARLVALGVAMYLARVLGAAGYGMVGAALSFTSYLMIAVHAGLDPFGVRQVARAPEEIADVFSQVLTARALLSLVMYAVLAALLAVIPDEAIGSRALGLVFGGRLFVQAVDTAWVLRGRDEMPSVTKGLWIRELANAALVLVLVRAPDPMILLVPVAYVAAEALRVLYYLRAVRRSSDELWRPKPLRALTPMIRESAPLAGAKALRLLFFEGDVLLIAWLASVTEGGYFLVSHKIVLALGVSLGTLYQENVYPTLSRLQAQDPEAATRFVERVNRVGLTAMLPLAVIVSAESAWLVDLLFGQAYRPAGAVLQVTAYAIPIVLLVGGLNNHLLAASRTADVLRSDLVATAVHLSTALFLVPTAGAIGGAWANVAGRVAALATASVQVGRLQHRFPFTIRTAGVVASGAIMATMVVFLPIPSTLLRLVVASTAYLVALFALRGLATHEVRDLLEHLRRS